MEELIGMVAGKANLSSDKAKTAVEAVLTFIKGKIPGIGGQLDALLSGGGSGEGTVADVAKKLGGMFGKT